MYKHPFFTIIIVCLNPGDKLKKTLDSVLTQTFTDYEIIIKDGMSQDGALDTIAKQPSPTIKIIQKPDTGIYDAMNQAITEVSGQYIYFLNCGDHLWNDNVLTNVFEKISDNNDDEAMIYYGNIFEELTGQEVYANPQINRFACFRYLPCHQACFYHNNLLKERSFDIEYKIRADQEYFIWAALNKGIKTSFIPLLIARYEGAGYSETKKNQKLAKIEHKKITEKYMTKTEILKYRFILFITLAPLRTALSRNKRFAAFYNQIKKTIYQRKSK